MLTRSGRMITLKISDLRKDFDPFKDKTLGILLFGSYALGGESEASDVDVCIVKPVNDVFGEINKLLGGKYDVKIFERLPLYIQMEIIRNHKIIYGEEIELSEYFYRFRRLWKDMELRVKLNRFASVEERTSLRRRWFREKRKILGEIRSF
jgi:predicted nucleotidyltransferase